MLAYRPLSFEIAKGNITDVLLLTQCSITEPQLLSSGYVAVKVLMHDAVEAHSCGDIVVKFTDEQYTTINQSTAGHIDLRVYVNCLLLTYKQLTKTLGLKHSAVD